MSVARALLTVLALAALTPEALAAGSQALGGDGESAPELSTAHYEDGIDAKTRAATFEQTAAAADDDHSRAAALAAAEGGYRDAVAAQSLAIKTYAHNHKAANELGYALRKLGHTTKAVGAYNYALGIAPDFYPAIEYRAEAYLTLGQIEDAKSAYVVLFQKAPALAHQLLKAMSSWLTTAEPSPAIEGFQAWVNERHQLASVTPSSDDTSQWQ